LEELIQLYSQVRQAYLDAPESRAFLAAFGLGEEDYCHTVVRCILTPEERREVDNTRRRYAYHVAANPVREVRCAG